MSEIPEFYKKRLRQVSRKYEVPLDSLSPDPKSQWDSKNPKDSYYKIKDQIKGYSPVYIDIESSEMYKEYLTGQRQKDWEEKYEEIKKVEKKIKKKRKTHVIHIKKGKKHYPFIIYVNGKVLSYSPTKNHAVKVKKDFILKVRHYNKNERDKLMIPTIQIKKQKGFKKLRF